MQIGRSVGAGGGLVGAGGLVGGSVGAGGGLVGGSVGFGGLVGAGGLVGGADVAVGLGTGVFVGGAGVLVGLGVFVGLGVLVGGIGVLVGGTAVAVGGTAAGGTAVAVGGAAVVGTAVAVGWGAPVGSVVLIGAGTAVELAGGAGAPATGAVVAVGREVGVDLTGPGAVGAAGAPCAGGDEWPGVSAESPIAVDSAGVTAVGLLAPLVSLLGALVAPATSGEIGALLVVVAPGLPLGSAVDSAPSSATLMKGAGAGTNSVGVGVSTTTLVGSSNSRLASPDWSASGSTAPGSNSESPDDLAEPSFKPRSGAYGPAAKFVTLGANRSNSPIVTSTTSRQEPTIIPMR